MKHSFVAVKTLVEFITKDFLQYLIFFLISSRCHKRLRKRNWSANFCSISTKVCYLAIVSLTSTDEDEIAYKDPGLITQ